MVVPRIGLGATRLSAVSGPPALDYRFQSGTPESNREPPAPKAGVLPSAPLPACLQSERPRPIRHPWDRCPNRGYRRAAWVAPGSRARKRAPLAIPGFATFCRRPRVLRSQWAGRCSNPRLLVFSQVLHRLSYQPNKKSPASSVTPGFSRVPLLRWPSVTSASGARGGYSPVDRQNPACNSVRECNSTARTSFLASPPQIDRIVAGGNCPSLQLLTRQNLRRFARILAHPSEDKTLELAVLFPPVRKFAGTSLSASPAIESPTTCRHRQSARCHDLAEIG